MRIPMLLLLLPLCSAVIVSVSVSVASQPIILSSIPSPSFAGVRASASASDGVASISAWSTSAAQSQSQSQSQSQWRWPEGIDMDIDIGATRSSPSSRASHDQSPSWDVDQLLDDADADDRDSALQLQQQEQEPVGGPGRRGSRRRMRYCDQWQCAGTAIEDRRWCMERCVYSWELSSSSDEPLDLIVRSSGIRIRSNHTDSSLDENESDAFDTAGLQLHARSAALHSAASD